MKTSVPTTTIHLKGPSGKPFEAFSHKMLASCHRSHDSGEERTPPVCSSVAGFVRRRESLFSRDPCRRRTTITIVCRSNSMILPERSAAQELPGQVQDLDSRHPD